MSTNTDLYKTRISVGWVWILPNSALDVPAIPVTTVDELGVETTTHYSINEYFAMPEANIGSIQNREPILPAKGTHSACLFDSDSEDITGFKAMLQSNGMIDGGKDYTLDGDTLYYEMPVTRFKTFLETSPLNHKVVV